MVLYNDRNAALRAVAILSYQSNILEAFRDFIECSTPGRPEYGYKLIVMA